MEIRPTMRKDEDDDATRVATRREALQSVARVEMGCRACRRGSRGVLSVDSEVDSWLGHLVLRA